jgi:hypothetical protein
MHCLQHVKNEGALQSGDWHCKMTGHKLADPGSVIEVRNLRKRGT